MEILRDIWLHVGEVARVVILGVARGGGGARRREGLCGGEGVGRKLPLRAELAPSPAGRDLLQAPRDVPDGPARSEREDRDGDVDDERVVCKEDGQEPVARTHPPRAGQSMLEGLPLIEEDDGADDDQAGDREAAHASRAPCEDAHGDRVAESRGTEASGQAVGWGRG